MCMVSLYLLAILCCHTIDWDIFLRYWCLSQIYYIILLLFLSLTFDPLLTPLLLPFCTLRGVLVNFSDDCSAGIIFHELNYSTIFM